MADTPMFSGSAADMLKKYGQAVPEQEEMSTLEEAQAAKKRMEAEKAGFCAEARSTRRFPPYPLFETPAAAF